MSCFILEVFSHEYKLKYLIFSIIPDDKAYLDWLAYEKTNVLYMFFQIGDLNQQFHNLVNIGSGDLKRATPNNSKIFI